MNPQSALEGRFRIERELGRGGMATVYLAQDLRQERLVALKLIHPEVTATLGPERFLREIKLTAKLRHPHILPLFDSGEAAGQLWYSMPYIEGESLRQRLTREQRIPLDQAIHIAGDVLAALAYAHQHGIVHRDIKPENILLEGSEAVLADFGIAHAMTAAGSERLTGVGMAIGTPAYMSPEQVTGSGPLDGRSDLYSFGCVLYEMVSGAPPFTGPTPQSVVAKHLGMAPPALPALTGRLSPAVARAISTSLAKSPDERFPTAEAFAAALDAGHTGKQLPARRGMAALAAVLLMLLGLTFYAGRRISSDTTEGSGMVASGLNRRLSQLTFGEGLEEWPAWSPDGTSLAYVAEVDGYRQLFVRTLANGSERRISKEPADNIQPAWTPDGKRLAFVRAGMAGGKLEPSDINGSYNEGGDIWTVELESGRETRLVQNAFGPAYSPAGDRLAFDAPWAGARRIWVADTNGRNPRQVTSDSSEAVVHTSPRWSPDGKRLVFRRIEKIKSDIVDVDVGSQQATRVTNDNVLDMDPVWAPDGNHIYFASSRGGGLNLWRIAVSATGSASGQPEQLTTGAGDDVEPTISPNGSRLVFAVRGINSDLWRMPLSPETGQPTGQPVPVVMTTRVESRGSWSPDGSTIAFNSDRLGEMNIWLHRMADSSERQVTQGPGGDYQPNWSPDGERLVFFSARGGNADIWSVPVSDGKLTRLTSDPATDTNPFYSPDGQWIAFISDRGGRADVWVMRADGAEPRQLTHEGVGGHFLRWSSDSRSIVFRAESGTQIRIYRVSVQNGLTTQLPDVSSGAHMSFSPDQSLILDVKGHKSLWIYPVSGQSPRQVFAFTNPDIRIDYPVWSPDGRWVLFDRAAPKGGDLWLMESASETR
ncbi:MAG TPA: protein kinase [Gemmatimonadales bacterium]|nr:protein kinase [Gemmatimonadales bacterium]